MTLKNQKRLNMSVNPAKTTQAGNVGGTSRRHYSPGGAKRPKEVSMNPVLVGLLLPFKYSYNVTHNLWRTYETKIPVLDRPLYSSAL